MLEQIIVIEMSISPDRFQDHCFEVLVLALPYIKVLANLDVDNIC